jgi:hypothetical protein
MDFYYVVTKIRPESLTSKIRYFKEVEKSTYQQDMSLIKISQERIGLHSKRLSTKRHQQHPETQDCLPKNQGSQPYLHRA